MEHLSIKVRPSTLEDCKQFYQWEATPQVTTFFSIADDQRYEDVVREFVLADDDPEKEQYTITDEDGQLLGRIYLNAINRKLDSLEIFRIYIGDTANRGKGYGRQALLWILDRAFRQDSFHRVYLDYYTGNPAQFLYESVGFQHEGCARGACKKMGVYHDVNIMAMLREDFEQLY
ncbi:RimJ/RimL family protein N-acetyltransferase [Clostridiales Family XIII bacterium PM5-7]